MSQPCGCCAGIQIITPQAEANPPGMSSIQYRVGTYATFYETMLARLSAFPALKHFTTRNPGDFSIALLDAWAVVGDVLSFYQERIANEGYLATAVERRSLLELARLVSYTLRPGVAASVYLAFTVQTTFSGTLPAGTRAQSMPGSGQMPQFFETSADLAVSDRWNNLQVRLTRPQTLSADLLTTLRTLYFQGISTNLKIGDGMILVNGSTQALRVVDAVTPQASDQRTQIHFRKALTTVTHTLQDVAQDHIKEAAALFPGSVIATQVALQLTSLNSQAQTLDTTLQSLQQLQAIASQRNLSRLSVWLTDLLTDLRSATNAAAFDASGAQSKSGPTPVSSFPLTQLSNIIQPLSLAQAIQPPNSISLPRALSQAFASQSDIAPRLLSTFHPAAATTLYQAWAGIPALQSPAAVYAVRVKCGLFANNFTGAVSVAETQSETSTASTRTTATVITAPVLEDAIFDLIVRNGKSISLSGLPLDAVYDQITVGSWVAISRPTVDAKQNITGQTTTLHLVQSVQTVTRATGKSVQNPTGFTAKVTQLSLEPQWLDKATDFQNALESTDVLRGTVIYAQAEALSLAPEPLDTDVGGGEIELDGLYDGLESGRFVIVSGNRTDVPGTTGVVGNELMMIAAVSQETATANDTVHTVLTLANSGLAYSYDSSSVTLYANVAAATQGQTVGEVLGNGDTSQPFQTFALHQSPLTYLSAATPSGAESTLTVTVNEIEWQQTDDIGALGPNDHAYTTLTDNLAQTSVIFGNGVNGARVPTGNANIKATYRYGIGSAGNVLAGQISQLATRPLGAQAVVNPLPATGGADADTVSQARSNTPIAVKALDRLVSVQDYADFSRSYAGIGKAASAKLSNGRRQVVFVTIAGTEDIPISLSSDLYQNLVQSLQQFGDPHQPLMVGVRRLKLLVIIAGIQVLPGYQFEDVEPKVQAALLDTFSFDKRTLGQPAFLSEAISAMQNVQGVAFVNVTVFDSVAEGVSAAALATLSTTLNRRGAVPAHPAQVDPKIPMPASPTAQELFQIQSAEIVYLTPDIKDTLILTEITPTNPGPPPRTKSRASRRYKGSV